MDATLASSSVALATGFAARPGSESSALSSVTGLAPLSAAGTSFAALRDWLECYAGGGLDESAGKRRRLAGDG